MYKRQAQLGGSLYHAPKLHQGPCSTVGVRPRTDRHTVARDHNTFCVVYTTHAKCKKFSCIVHTQSDLPSSCRQRFSSSTASCGDCRGSVPRPTNRRGCVRTVCARSSFSRRHRSNASAGFACYVTDYARYSLVLSSRTRRAYRLIMAVGHV